MLSYQPEAVTGCLLECDNGTGHSISEPETIWGNPEPYIPPFTFRVRKVCGRIRTLPPVIPYRSDRELWNELKGEQPTSARMVVLLYIARGNGFHTEDVRRLIGAHETTGVRGDRNPSFWKLHTANSPRIDQWISEELPDYLGFDYSPKWANEVENAISEITSSRQARQILISEYRKAIRTC